MGRSKERLPFLLPCATLKLPCSFVMGQLYFFLCLKFTTGSMHPEAWKQLHVSAVRLHRLVILFTESWCPGSSLMIPMLLSWVRGLAALQLGACLGIVRPPVLELKLKIFAMVADRWCLQWDRLYLQSFWQSSWCGMDWRHQTDRVFILLIETQKFSCLFLLIW